VNVAMIGMTEKVVKVVNFCQFLQDWDESRESSVCIGLFIQVVRGWK